ncbi:MAG: CHAT domain-containing protein [Planctomycetota bacterium]
MAAGLLIALGVLLAPPQQESVRDLALRFRAAQEAFDEADDESERSAALGRLAEFEPGLRDRLRNGPANERSYIELYLSQTLVRLAAFDETATDAECLTRFHEAREHARAYGKERTIARVRVMLAHYHIARGRPREARDELLTSLVEEPSDHDMRPSVLLALGEAQRQLGAYADALAQLEACRALLPRDQPWAAATHAHASGRTGQVYLELGLADVAEPWVEELERLADSDAAANKDQVAARILRANLELIRERLPLLIESLPRQLADEELFPPRSSARGVLLGALGEALVRIERRGAPAGERPGEVLAEALACDLPERDRVLVRWRLAQWHLDHGRTAAAEENLIRARELLAAPTPEERGGPLQEELVLAEAEARLALARGDDREELVRARDRLLDAELRRRSAWEALPPRAGGIGRLQHPTRRERLCTLTSLTLAVAEGEAAADEVASLWGGFPGSGSLSRALDAEPATLALLRRGLVAEGGALLAIQPGPVLSYLLAVDANDAFVLELAGEAVLAELVEAARGGGSALARLAAELLPQELASWLAERDELTFVGAELVGDPPLALLPLAGGGTLGSRLALARLPSLSLGPALLRREAERSGSAPRYDLVLAANPTPHAEVQERFPSARRLPFGERERAELVRPLDPGRLLLLEGDAATPDALADAMPAAHAAQLLVHGVRDETRERPATLVLSPQGDDAGLLDATRIEAWSGAPALVILTACGTAEGPLRLGDEAQGHLGGAWLRAGARCVLLADRELSLHAATELSHRLLRRLFQHGDSPAEALRAVRADWALDGRDQAELAGLRLLGLGHVPLVEPRAMPAASGLAEGRASRRDAPWAAVALAVAATIAAAGALVLARRARDAD